MGFFKLTKWKVIITLILTVIFEYLVYISSAYTVLCKTCDPSLVACPPCISQGAGYIIALITLIPALLVIYLLVCLIIYIYEKVRK